HAASPNIIVKTVKVLRQTICLYPHNVELADYSNSPKQSHNLISACHKIRNDCQELTIDRFTKKSGSHPHCGH
ncbi:MAG: hypothetical protein KJN99_09060, partial [Marinicaulis sp.]|nr:hypothetical protein [Marinicaulis sp.]